MATHPPACLFILYFFPVYSKSLHSLLYFPPSPLHPKQDFDTQQNIDSTIGLHQTGPVLFYYSEKKNKSDKKIT